MESTTTNKPRWNIETKPQLPDKRNLLIGIENSWHWFEIKKTVIFLPVIISLKKSLLQIKSNAALLPRFDYLRKESHTVNSSNAPVPWTASPLLMGVGLSRTIAAIWTNKYKSASYYSHWKLNIWRTSDFIKEKKWKLTKRVTRHTTARKPLPPKCQELKSRAIRPNQTYRRYKGVSRSKYAHVSAAQNIRHLITVAAETNTCSRCSRRFKRYTTQLWSQ